MRVLVLTATVVALAAPFTSTPRSTVTAQEEEDVSRSDASRGAALFSRFCQRCHEPRGPEERTDREWVMIMQHMEMRGDLTTERSRLVREFLRASSAAARSPGRLRSGLAVAPDPSSFSPQMLDEGRAIFRGAGGCEGCHGRDLERGVIAPSLRDDRWRTGDGNLPSILDIVRNGIPGTAMAPYAGGISDEMAIKVAGYTWAVNQGTVQP